MNSRTLIAAAVAAACTWPALATAARDNYSGEAGYWTLSTPASVNESAPWRAADSTRVRMSQPAAISSTLSAPTFAEVITPVSVSESAPWQTLPPARARNVRIQSASLASPQTPWSPNESAPARYNEDMRVRAQQVASVQQTRDTIARIESERLAAIERERLAAIERERLAAIERERLANAVEKGTVVGVAPSDNKAAVESSAASADGAANAPAAPGERPAQPGQTAGLVDTRGNRPLSLTMTPETGPAEASTTAASESGTTAAITPVGEGAMSDTATISGSAATPSGASLSDTTSTPTATIGATRGEGTSVSGAGPVINERPLQPNESTATLPEAPFNAANAPSSTESTSANAYVTLHESATAATTR